ncbi:putative bifunctional diguanylate cyclase/phosphodiesterase, partial [Polymorphobacter multimanifer]
MSMMFRPPIATMAAIGWKQVLGFGHGDDPFFARVRAAQLAVLNRYVPFNVGLFMVNAVMLAHALRNHPRAGFVVGWVTVVGALSALWIARFRRNGPELAVETVTRTQFWMITIEVLAFGLLWAVMELVMMPEADQDGQTLLLLLSLAAMGACGFATAIMPVCGLLTTFCVGAAMLVALPAGSPLHSPAVIAALVTYWLLIARGVMVTSFALMGRLRTQESLAEQSEVVRLLLNEFESNGSDWLLDVDAEGMLVHVSPRLAQVACRPAETLIGMSFVQMLGTPMGQPGTAALRALVNVFRAGQAFRDLVVQAQVGGETRWWALSGTPKRRADGSFGGYRGVGRDVTEVRRGQDRIAQLARFDPLTGLANRTLFREALEDALARAGRTRRSCALLFIDLDRFKPVNDAHGHAAGDRLLGLAAERLRVAVGGGATIARLGGDEFAVVLPGTTERRAEAVATAVVAAMAEPFALGEQCLQIGASVGWAMGPGDGASADRLLKSADLALYAVKSGGRGAACRFEPAIRARAEERRTLETELGGALARGELRLAFQPVVDAHDEQIVGFEALLRWGHPELGNVTPDRFIPVAEETGLIVPIGHWVIEEACRWAARWPANVTVAVNLSPAQIDDPRLVAVVA